MSKPKIVIFANYFLPGYKAGGPIRSIEGLIDRFYNNYDFYVITTDRDYGDTCAYEGIKKKKWMDKGKYKIYYIHPREINKRIFLKALNKINSPINLLYANSFLSKFTRVLLRLKLSKRFSKTPFLLAPRGEFSPGALKLQKNKKKLYISYVKMLKLLNHVQWHASTYQEEEHIKKIFPHAEVLVAQNLSTVKNVKHRSILKEKGSIKLIYLSRITPKKNLMYALEILRNIKGNVQFDIFGVIDDNDYYEKCKKIVRTLPQNISCSFKGPVPHAKVPIIMSNYHFFILPTLGENFGHVIFESLISGTPVLISNQTPWKSMSIKQLGWDLDLANKNEWEEKIRFCVDMGTEKYNELSDATYLYGKEISEDKEVIKENKTLLKKATTYNFIK